MSLRYSGNDYTQDGDAYWKEYVEENREDIEYEANSDAPDAWVFQNILDYYEEELS